MSKRPGFTRRPVQPSDNGLPKSQPGKPGAGKGSTGRPESQKPAPRGRMIDD